MSEAVDEKAVELMDKAATAAEKFAVKLDALATEYGPEVADAALAVARIDAISAALSNLALIAIFLIVLPISVGGIKELARLDDTEKTTSAEYTSAGIRGIGCGVVALFTGIGCLIEGVFWNIWPYVGVLEPKLWIAKQVLGL